MNHKYSTYVLLFIFGVIGTFILVGALESEDIDDICDEDNRLLYRYNGTWECGQLDFGDFNVTYNYNINYTNNTYISLNESDPIFIAWNKSYSDITGTPDLTIYLKNGTDINVLMSNVQELCIDGDCISSWSEISSSGNGSSKWIKDNDNLYPNNNESIIVANITVSNTIKTKNVNLSPGMKIDDGGILIYLYE